MYPVCNEANGLKIVDENTDVPDDPELTNLASVPVVDPPAETVDVLLNKLTNEYELFTLSVPLVRKLILTSASALPVNVPTNR